MDGSVTKSIEGKVLSVDCYPHFENEEDLEDGSNDMMRLLIETSKGINSINFKFKNVDDLTVICLNKMFKGNFVLYRIRLYDSNCNGTIFEHYLKIISGPFYSKDYFYYS